MVMMLFYELLQVAIGRRVALSQNPTAEAWHELYAMAKKQAMAGIAFRGVEQLPDEQRPPKWLMMQWYMATERIKAMNADMDLKALAVANTFLREGFPNVILKGQGIAKLYVVKGAAGGSDDDDDGQPKAAHSGIGTINQQSQTAINDDLALYRTPGDIDIWLGGGRYDILRYVKRHVPNCKPVYHHVDFPVIDGLDIEVHFVPSWMYSSITNRRLQRFFRTYVPMPSSTGDYTTLPVPDTAFNRVYILVHIYRHLFQEGIGLRQLLDYYFVLCQGFTAEERDDTMRTLRSLKMGRFASAVMWVLQEVYAMDDRYLLTSPNEREGRFLLDEIMLAGNFGQHDERMQHVRGESALHWGMRKVVRNFRFVRSYPSEVLWTPIFKLWHFFWMRGLQVNRSLWLLG